MFPSPTWESPPGPVGGGGGGGGMLVAAMCWQAHPKVQRKQKENNNERLHALQ